MVDHIVHDTRDDSSSSVLIAVVVILLVLVVGWLAYNGGAFGARDRGPDTIDVDIGGGPAGTPTPAPTGGTGGSVTY